MLNALRVLDLHLRRYFDFDDSIEQHQNERTLAPLLEL